MEKTLRLIEIYRLRFQEVLRRISEEVDKPEAPELNGVGEDLASKWNALRSLYESAIDDSETDELEARVNAMEDCRTQYHKARGLIAKTKESRQSVPPPSDPSEPEPVSSHHVFSAVIAKLTATKIPTFAGETLKWPEFWGLYELTIHNLPGLSSLEKFVRLKEALKGEASAVVEGLPLTSSNYCAAIEQLLSHYGSTDVIIQENFRQLHNLPVVPPGNHKALKQFLMEGEVRIRSLESLGVAYDGYARPFVSHLVDRLPRNLRTAWYRSASDRDDQADVKDVLAFLRKEVMSQERSQSSESSVRKRTNTLETFTGYETKKTRLIPSVASMTSMTRTGFKGDSRNECVFCRLPHSPLKCPLPLQKKLEAVKLGRLCYACLRKGHQVSNCKNPNPNCRRCKRRHHTALCRDDKDQPNQDVRNNPTTSTTKTSASLCTTLPQGGDIFLKTVTVFLYGPKGKMKVTCLIDEGSQRSYVTDHVAEELGLSYKFKRFLYAHLALKILLNPQLFAVFALK
ncbi:uncharacterized protein LOC130702702 [Daphnia carinata]|uniref:uncharacterized protein LOC130702702 n=1 Tax=Daphnia carinata TaxID=120202 RepID=UPI00257B4525|nr:uncharacterized protein LOC130702702 [Daphnia carinata]